MAESNENRVVTLESMTITYTVEYKDGTLCPLCRSALLLPCVTCGKSGKYQPSCPSTQLSCKHVFHNHCIEKYSASNTLCPIDRTQISIEFKNLDDMPAAYGARPHEHRAKKTAKKQTHK